MDKDTIKIKLKIADFIHPMTIERSKEEEYRKAAKMVDRCFTNYKVHFNKSVTDDNMILSFVALDFALRFLAEKQNNDADLLRAKIEGLTREIEHFLQER